MISDTNMRAIVRHKMEVFMSRKGRSFSPEFKLEAASLVVEQG
ncbi:hypothetical protein SAMN05660420_01241 [Desulfuromusa kysingii]|uniref:Transposase n=1 Tax=Desulfuromusa kysingii TaxID=37625 RepID=A0A1H3YHC0_9BACT|nr:hypothetical protein SAMN05660420_01241 [Desulfuromusa kysingii]